MPVKVKDHLTYCPVLLIKTTNKVPCLSPVTIQLFSPLSKFFFSFFCDSQNFPFTLLSLLIEIFVLLFSNRSNIFQHFHAGQTKAETDWLYCPCSLFGSFLWATRFLQWGPSTRYVIWCLWLWMLDFVIVNPTK